MMPIALASGAGAEWKNGLAWVIMGGLLSSLFLTLIIVPVMYAAFDGIIRRVNKGKKPQPVAELMVQPYKEEQMIQQNGHDTHLAVNVTV